MKTHKKIILLAMAFLLIAAPFALLMGGVVVLRGGGTFGTQFLHVLSASMQPALMQGDLIIVRPYAPERVRVGDIITYMSDFGGLITHRAREVLTELNGEQGLWFVTKGDANATRDRPVEANRLVGRMTGRLPGMGAILNWLRDHLVVSLLAMVLLLLLSSPAAVLLLWLALRKRRTKIQNIPPPPL